jgi:hypothetical protein
VSAVQRVTVHTSQDIWVLGVMVYEVISQGPTFAKLADVFSCASGEQLYPWEADEQPHQWRQSRLCGLVLPCLSRDLARRPTAGALLESILQVGSSTAQRQGHNEIACSSAAL